MTPPPPYSAITILNGIVTLGTWHFYDILSPVMAETPKTILIAGAGFGGMTAALKLERRLRNNHNWNIVLIDKNTYQLYTPALYEIAAIPKEEVDPTGLQSAIAIPIADIIAGKKITFVHGEVAHVDREKRSVRMRGDREFQYAFLILALGSETNYFEIPGLREHALPLKRFEDAVKIRNKIERALMERRELTLVVGGAGMSGIELIGELSNFICYLAQRILNEPTCPVRLALIEASDTILPGLDHRVARSASKRLTKLGIEIHTNTRITSVTPKEIMTNDTRAIPYDILVWTGGVMGNPSYAVNEFLQIGDYTFAVGDAAGFIDAQTGKVLPHNVPVAEAEARSVARNILRAIKGKPKIPFRPSKRYPYVLAIGRKYAIADLIFIRFRGFAGWCLKLLVELRYLIFILSFSRAIQVWLKSIRVYTSND